MGRTHSFGYWLRRQRLALDLTQAALAREVGCATVTIRKIEADERRPSRQMAERLADCLTIPDDERDLFIACGRGERVVDALPLPREPVDAAWVTTPGPGLPATADEEHTPRQPFVAREREMALLHQHLAGALGGDGHIVFISGEAGRGKSTLMAEFARAAQAAHPDLLVSGGSCSAYAGFGDPYLPFREILTLLYGDLPAGQAARRLTAENAGRLWHFWPHAVRMLLEHAPELIGGLVSAAVINERVAARGYTRAPWAEQLQTLAAENQAPSLDRLFERVTALLHALAGQQPLLLLLDDLQWADSASLHLLFHLGRRLSGSRILVLGAYRPVDAAARPQADEALLTLPDIINEMQRRSGDILVDLDHFDVTAGRGFVDALLDAEPNQLDDEFRLRLFWRTRGHPLFTVELLREMRARGELVQNAEGVWLTGENVDWETVPARVDAVIAQRIERVPSDLRELLDLASVEGESFTAEVLATVQGVSEGSLLRQLADIERRYGLLREQGETVAGTRRLNRYQFSHVLFREYIYQHLSQGQRQHLHGRVASALEALYGANFEPVLAQLAHHYDAARDARNAVRFMVQAGDRARMLYAHREAAGHYERAVALLQEMGDRAAMARVLMKLGLTYQIAFDHERAQQAFDRAFTLWPGSAGVPEAESAALGTRAPVSRSPALHPLRLLWQDPPSLDPTMGGYNLTAPVAMQLFSGLVAYGPDNEIVPDIAHRWEIEDDGRRYVFHLRDDAFWSDGERVTAHDFEYTYRRALDPATQAPVAGQLLAAVRGAQAFHSGEQRDAQAVGVTARDDHTLVFELEAHTSYFIHNLAYYVLLPTPRHVVEVHGAGWASPEKIVTNGPFRLAGWEPGDFMLLERNPGYHGPFTGNLEQVQLTLGQPPAAQVDLYAADELDVASNWFATVPDIVRLRERFPAEYVMRPSFVTHYYFVTTAEPPLNDVRVRRALAMALDRSLLADVHLAGYVEAATGGFVPPGMPGHVPGCALPFAPTDARALLREAGPHAFPDVRMLAYPRAEIMARFLQQSWVQVLGIDIRLELVEPSQLAALAAEPQPTIFVGGWWADYPDPDNFLRVDVDMDLPEWRHPTYANLLAQAARSGDQDERLQLYRQAERILAAEAPLVPLVYSPFHLMLKPWVKRYPTSAVKNPGSWKDVIMEPR